MPGEIESTSAVGGWEENDLGYLANVDEETGLVRIYVSDEKAVQAIKYGDFSAWETIVKAMIVIRHNENKAHSLNDEIRKGIIQVSIDNVVKSYNGHLYVVCQVASAGISLGMSVLSFTPASTMPLFGRVTAQWDVKDPAQMRECSRWLAKLGTTASQPPQIAGGFFDKRDECFRQEYQLALQPLNTEDQNSGGAKSQASQAEKELLQQLEKERGQKAQVFGTLCR